MLGSSVLNLTVLITLLCVSVMLTGCLQGGFPPGSALTICYLGGTRRAFPSKGRSYIPWSYRTEYGPMRPQTAQRCLLIAITGLWKCNCWTLRERVRTVTTEKTPGSR